MKRPAYTLEIDRLNLDGFDLTPHQAERVRRLVQTELQHMLAQQAAPARAATRQVDPPAPVSLNWQPAQGEQALASGIAQHVAQAVRSQVKPGG